MIRLCMVILAAAILAGCLNRSTVAPAATGITDPLARIPVRQEGIKRAAAETPPNVPTINLEADATIGDVREARAAVARLQAEIDAMKTAHAGEVDALEAVIAAKDAALAQAQGKARQWYDRFILGIQGLCAVGVGLGVLLAVVKDLKYLALSIAGIATFGTIIVMTALERFINLWMIPIAGGFLVLMLAAGIYALWDWRRRGFELVKSGELLIEKAGGVKAVAPTLDRIQSGSTKRLVDEMQAKLARAQRRAAKAAGVAR